MKKENDVAMHYIENGLLKHCRLSKESDHETNLIPSSLEMIDKFMTYAFLLNESYFTVG